MDVTSTQPTQTNVTQPSAATESASAALSSDFDTFLTLLTAQMKYQDPLEPTDSTEFVAQLASFSGLEQQIRTNETLDQLLTAMTGQSDIIGLADWIGQEVRVATSVNFDGTPVDIETTPNRSATSATLVVTDDFGQTVLQQTVSTTETNISWNGLTNAGTVAPIGEYSFEIKYFNGDTEISDVQGRVFVPVTEVRLTGTDPLLITENGTEVPLSQVTAVRQPEQL